jgi:beta-glucanase (GH16 family)
VRKFDYLSIQNSANFKGFLMMLTKVAVRVFGLMLIMLAIVPTGPAWSAGWQLVFSDEFDGDKLDRTKWATRYIYNNETMDHFQDENERYRDNHIVSGGVLSVVAKKNDGSTLFESAMIRSHRTFYYGYYEARVFLPSAKGVFPAFWLEADYDLDGKTWHPPEIDIFEFVINGVEDKGNSLHSNTVGNWTPQSYTFVDSSFLLKFQNMMSKEDLNRAWHTAGFVWAPDRISLFWDGRLIYTRMYQWLRKDGQLGPPAHVDLNFAVGGSKWAGRYGIDEAAFPQTFKIDYVRVCQFTSSDQGKRQCGPSELTPDPKDFGYVSALNDMPKPAFMGVKKAVADRKPNAGVMSLNAAEPLNFEIPIKIPENYPADRVLQVSVADEATGVTLASANSKLQKESLKKGADGASVVELSLPPIQRPGNYIVAAKLTADVADEKGARQVLPSPVTCSTDVIQPVKARSCRLLSLQVH